MTHVSLPPPALVICVHCKMLGFEDTNTFKNGEQTAATVENE